MGTNGLFGFILHNIKYLIYVQYDAHNLYDDLTKEIYIIMKHYENNIVSVKEAFQKLKIVTENDSPNDEDIEKTKYFQSLTVGLVPDAEPLDLLKADGDCKRLHNLNIGEKSSQKWYCLLRECQGSFIKVLESGYVLQAEPYPYGYIFIWNLDYEIIEYNSFDAESGQEIGFSLKSAYIVLKENSTLLINYEDIVNKIKNDFEIRHQELNYTPLLQHK
jgi:hypothetical protein